MALPNTQGLLCAPPAVPPAPLCLRTATIRWCINRKRLCSTVRGCPSAGRHHPRSYIARCTSEATSTRKLPVQPTPASSRYELQGRAGGAREAAGGQHPPHRRAAGRPGPSCSCCGRRRQPTAGKHLLRLLQMLWCCCSGCFCALLAKKIKVASRRRSLLAHCRSPLCSRAGAAACSAGARPASELQGPAAARGAAAGAGTDPQAAAQTRQGLGLAPHRGLPTVLRQRRAPARVTEVQWAGAAPACYTVRLTAPAEGVGPRCAAMNLAPLENSFLATPVKKLARQAPRLAVKEWHSTCQRAPPTEAMN